MEEQAKDFKDYLDALRRNRKLILIISAAVFTVSLLVAFLLPPVYQSSSTILIEEQDIPQDLVRTTISSYADQRIQIISQRVMTRSNLMGIIDKYHLYEKNRRIMTTEEIIGAMREDIKLQTISASVVDPRSGRAAQATIAFTLAFNGPAPEVTQKVTTELTSLFLNENLKSRTEQTQEAYAFLSNEADKLNQQISDYGKRIAEFKQKNAGRLPELTGLNQQMMERARSEIDANNAEIRSIQERKFYLEGQLAQIKPVLAGVSASGEPVPDAETRLKALRTQYISASARYAPDHPDVVRLRREIEALGGSVDDAGTSAAQRLESLRADLAATEKKYSPDHPDVIKLRKEIAALEQNAHSAHHAAAKPAATETPDNPAYITLQSQLESADSSLKALQEKDAQLEKKLSEYEQRIAETPQVEREYLDLTRGLENAQTKFRDIKAKQMEAELARQLEKESKGERFSLIDPPQLPEAPVSPNRPALMFLGLVLSLGSGLGYAAVKETLDTSVHNPKGVAALFDAPPLSVIPYMENAEDRRRRERLKKRLIIALVAAFVVALLLIHFFWSPLDVLWFRVLRKIGTLLGV